MDRNRIQSGKIVLLKLKRRTAIEITQKYWAYYTICNYDDRE